MLEIEGLSTGYGRVQVLWDLCLKVEEGEFVALVGANGAGKTTLLKTISGVMKPWSGSITFLDRRIDTVHANDIVDMGLSHIPESRRLFTDMSIKENLEMGAYPRRTWKQRRETMKWVFKLFPRLQERQSQLARTLSGGEQQMLAISRALMSGPEILLLDEPTLGLAPILVEAVMETVARIRDEGVTVLMVEQNATQALEISDRGYILEAGVFVKSGPGPDLARDPEIRRAYLGG